MLGLLSVVLLFTDIWNGLAPNAVDFFSLVHFGVPLVKIDFLLNT